MGSDAQRLVWGRIQRKVERLGHELPRDPLLYALGVAGVPSGNPVVGRARGFLLTTQRDDGSWLVNGTKRAKQHRAEPTSIYWGTAWATIGLIGTLPP